MTKRVNLPNLERGDEGQAVRTLQADLNRVLGDGEAIIMCGGVYGVLTEMLVQRAQKKAGLDQTGKVDQDLWVYLRGVG